MSSARKVLIAPAPASNAPFSATTVSLPHPRLGSELTFLRSAGSVLEVNAVAPSKYCSFFADSTVIPNGSLHVATPLDPLFLLLPSLPSLLSRFCPYDQFLSTLPGDELRGLCSEALLARVCATSDAMGDDMLLYKFDEGKAVGCLKKKYER
ncbi:hypothetical protein TeGR_g3450, partial [Tetraparma gracilis]